MIYILSIWIALLNFLLNVVFIKFMLIYLYIKTPPIVLILFLKKLFKVTLSSLACYHFKSSRRWIKKTMSQHIYMHLIIPIVFSNNNKGSFFNHIIRIKINIDFTIIINFYI